MKARVDGLPEYQHFVDRGCKYHDKCLTCPFVVCILDYDRAMGSKVHGQTIAREIQAWELYKTLNVPQVALTMGISRRQVFRLLASYKERNDITA